MAITAAASRSAGAFKPPFVRSAASRAGLVAGLLALDAIVAGAIAEPRLTRLLVLIAAALAVTFAFRFPFATTCVMLILTDSIFHAGYFAASVGPLGVKLEEVMLVLVGVVAVMRPVRAWWGGFPGATLLVFLGIVVVASWLALTAGRVDLTSAFNWGRPFVFLLVFFIVVRLFPEREQLRRLLTTACVLAALTGLMAIVVTAVPSLGPHLSGPGQQEIRPFGSLTRVHLPGLGFAYMLFWWAVLEMLGARGERRAGFVLILLGMAANLGLSFNRNMWVGTVLGLGLLLVLTGVRSRRRVLAGLAGVGLSLAVFVVLLGSVGPPGVFDPIVQRGQTLLNPQAVGEEDSLTSREDETRHAWVAAKAHPLTGIGPGANFGVFYNQSVGGGRYQRVEQDFLHNQYLYLVLVGGIPALVTFMFFLGSVLRRTWGVAEREPALTALGVGMVMLMVSAFVMPYYSVPDMTAAIGLIGGVIVAWRRPGDLPGSIVA